VAPGRVWRGGVSAPAAEEQRAKQGEQSMCQRRKKGGGPRDLVGIYRNLRDSSVNWIFLLIQSSNEKMVKIEVVEVFNSYNFA
jgi:hypothetical protein